MRAKPSPAPPVMWRPHRISVQQDGVIVGVHSARILWLLRVPVHPVGQNLETIVCSKNVLLRAVEQCQAAGHLPVLRGPVKGMQRIRARAGPATRPTAVQAAIGGI